MSRASLDRHPHRAAIAAYLYDAAARAGAVGAWKWAGELLRLARELAGVRKEIEG